MNVMDTRKTSAMLYLDGVHVSFDGFHAINNLSLALEPGEMRAIIGPNGAGKTTMMDIITGKTKPDEGVVLTMCDRPGTALADWVPSRRNSMARPSCIASFIA